MKCQGTASNQNKTVTMGQVRVLELYPETNFLAMLWPLSPLGNTARNGWNREKSHVTAHCSGFTLGSVRQTVLSHVEDGQVRVLELYPETNFLAILWPLSGDTVRDGWNREKSHVTTHSSVMSAVICASLRIVAGCAGYTFFLRFALLLRRCRARF